MDRKGTQQEQLGSVLGFLKERGTTQKEVAEAIGTDEGTLSSLKSGKVKNVPKEILNALEEKYGINLFGLYILPRLMYLFQDYHHSASSDSE